MSGFDHEKLNRVKKNIRQLSFAEYGQLSQWAKRYERETDWSRKK